MALLVKNWYKWFSVIGNNFGEFKGLCKKNLHESHLPGELGHCISLDREFSQNFNSIYEQTGEWLLRFGSISDFNKNLMSNSASCVLCDRTHGKTSCIMTAPVCSRRQHREECCTTKYSAKHDTLISSCCSYHHHAWGMMLLQPLASAACTY